MKSEKKLALKFIAKYGQSTIQKLIASAASDQDVPDRDFVMQTQSEFIASEGDCGDFFFVPLLLFYLKFPDSFSDKEREQLLQLALNWRYWIDEPGNDTRWYFSENHAICFRTAQLLAGEIWPDEIFVRSGCKGKLQSRTASSRISKWLDNFEKHGLLEWNSMSYIPIDLIALFGIFMSEDKELASRAKSSLDEVFSILATTHYAGEISSSQGRVYPRDIKARRSQETTFLSWIAWGQGYVNKHALATTLFAISDYSPPPELARQAKPSCSDFRSCTILDDTKIVQLRAPHFSMSSACNYMPGNPGYQEHIFHLNLGRDPKACLFLNHPGSTDPGSIRRPGFWVGNGILPYVNQLDNTVFVYYDLPDDCPIGFTQLYCPENVFDRIETSDHGITIAHRGAYCAIRTLQTISPPSHSDVKNSHLRQYGNQTAWIVHAASEGNYESFESYREELMSPAFDRFWKFSGLSSL